jgi:hypothetical protein
MKTSSWLYDALDRPTRLTYLDTNSVQKSYGLGIAFQKSDSPAHPGQRGGHQLQLEVEIPDGQLDRVVLP